MSSSEHGPLPRFTAAHVWLVLDILARAAGPLGRAALATAAGIGEGSMRTILELLRKKRFVSIRRAGIMLTNSGRRFVAGAPLTVLDIDAGDATVDEHDVAVLVRGGADRVTDGMKQRDDAIKAGASGATTIVNRDGRLLIPPDTALRAAQPALTERLANMLRPGDMVVIGTGPTRAAAALGALAAALVFAACGKFYRF